MVLVHVRFLRQPITVQIRCSIGSINTISTSSIDLNNSDKPPKSTLKELMDEQSNLKKGQQQQQPYKSYNLAPKGSMAKLLNEYYQKEDTVVQPSWWTKEFKEKYSSKKDSSTSNFQRNTRRGMLNAQSMERNQMKDERRDTIIGPPKTEESYRYAANRKNTRLNALLEDYNRSSNPESTSQTSDRMRRYEPMERRMGGRGENFDKEEQALQTLRREMENSSEPRRGERRPGSKPFYGRGGARELPRNYKARSTDDQSEEENETRHKRNVMAAERFLYATELQQLFDEHSLPDKQQGDQEHADIPLMDTWQKLYKIDLQKKIYNQPKNAYDEFANWTKEGKMWKFPIDNEQGMEEEQNIHFSQHIFLDQHLEDWCPTEGPIRHYMELVCIGLSKNPYLTVEEKITHITWYKNYFTERAQLLEELDIWNTSPAQEANEASQEQ